MAADVDIAARRHFLNGWMLAPQGKAILLSAVDGNDRPLFINSVAEGAVPMILGAPVRQAERIHRRDGRCRRSGWASTQATGRRP